MWSSFFILSLLFSTAIHALQLQTDYNASESQLQGGHIPLVEASTNQIKDVHFQRSSGQTHIVNATPARQINGNWSITSTGYRHENTSQGQTTVEHERQINSFISVNKDVNCAMTVSEHSVQYFKSRLVSFEPNFMHIKLAFYLSGYVNSTPHPYNSTPDTFRPDQWVWTYTSSRGLYPYLHWNIDYGLLSFGLLDAKTLRTVPYINLTLSSECPVTFGSPTTTAAIANALLDLTSRIAPNDTDTKYMTSMYCYLAKSPNINGTIAYLAAIYLLYPINYMNYNCCETWYSYTNASWGIDCLPDQMEKWIQCTLGPYFLGIVIFFYFPILLFEICSWIEKEERICPNQYELLTTCSDGVENENNVTTGDTDWLFLDGTPPRSFTDLFGTIWCGFDQTHPVPISRIRRLVCVLVTPSVVYVEVLIYFYFMEPKGIITGLIDKGTPMGFLSLMGDGIGRIRATFAPLLGGPICILVIFHLLGILFIVLPKSLKQIVENGMPTNSAALIKSPLCLGADDIRKLANIPTMVNIEPGYSNAAHLCRCSIYIIFSKSFWANVLEIQTKRIYDRIAGSQSRVVLVFKLAVMPMYVIFCLLESLACIIFYGIPFFTFVSIMVKGAIRALIGMQEYGRLRHRKAFSVLSNPVVAFVSAVVVFAMFLFFAYAVCLIWIQSFLFLSQIIVFCFVAVIVYPSVSFGYLFFFVVLLYYVVRLIRDFGYTYLELLSEAVEISRNLDEQTNCVSTSEGCLIISNVKAVNINQIYINNKNIQVPHNVLQSIFKNVPGFEKIKLKNNMFGVPKRLFDVLVQKHLPVHQQVIKIVLHLIFIVLLVFITMSITAGFVTGPTSEISDVMHVIFIVTVGALPRVLEVAMMNSSESVKKEIERRHIEETVVNFWQQEIQMV